MRIWITGATGLLGSALVRRAVARKHTVIAVGHGSPWREPPEGEVRRIRVDLRDEGAVTRQLLEDFPDAILNAAAFSENRQCLQDPEGATRINAELPGLLGRLANHLSARLVHVSTEQVFPGNGGRDHPLTAETLPAPLNLYGRLKWAGEKAALETAPEFAVVLRLPLLQGNSPSGDRSFHERLFALWAKGERLPLFTDQWRQPCSADSAAEAIVELAEKPSIRGLHHWAGRELVTRYEMGLALARHFRLPESWVGSGQMAGDPRFAEQPPCLPLSIGSLGRDLRTVPESMEAQMERLRVPVPVQGWYQSLPRLEDLPEDPPRST